MTAAPALPPLEPLPGDLVRIRSRAHWSSGRVAEVDEILPGFRGAPPREARLLVRIAPGREPVPITAALGLLEPLPRREP